MADTVSGSGAGPIDDPVLRQLLRLLRVYGGGGSPASGLTVFA